ncbi:DsbA family protein [Limosilactobacillus sp.]|uniref:DsbA family protein n=1 Tax=Limosilactobacillus sp. TaxID=2773925 RepID=UPI003F07DEE4
MLEIHLFVNPLGMRCFRCENDVLRVDQELNTKINYQFIPLFNMQTITDTLRLHGLSSCDLKVRQHVADTIFQVILDYKAALFQGRKRGRRYLLQLQDAMVRGQADYSPQLVEQVAEQSKLDLEMFMEDRRSKLARQAFRKDQRMAAELGVTQTATAVVFDTDQTDYGYLIANFDYETLIQAFRANKLDHQQSAAQFAAQFHRPALKIIQK